MGLAGPIRRTSQAHLTSVIFIADWGRGGGVLDALLLRQWCGGLIIAFRHPSVRVIIIVHGTFCRVTRDGQI